MKNILFIVAEEMRHSALSCYGNTFCATPHLDALAATGMRFSNHFPVHGKCVPSRIGMITGTYPSALGCRDLFTYPSPDHHGNVVSFLRERGYRTALIGKNHAVPTKRVGEYFDFFPAPGPSFQNYRIDDYDGLSALGKAMYQGCIPHPVEETRDSISVDQLGQFLGDTGDQPFFAWLNFENSHPPYCACEPYFSSIDRSRVPAPKRCSYDDKPAFMRILHETWHVAELTPEELVEIKAVYHAQVRVVDDMVGRVVALLEARGVADDTLVVFTSDHGDWAGEFGLVEKWDTAFHEEIIHTPLIIAGAGVRGAGRVSDAFIENIDLLPTALDLLGIEGYGGAQHARSFAPILCGESDTHRDSAYAEGGMEAEALGKLTPISRSPRSAYEGKHLALHRDPLTLASARMLRTRDHKLVLRAVGTSELYDLRADPGECVNLFHDPASAEVRLVLTSRLAQRMMEAAPRHPRLPAVGITA